jgi:hypothetical protein
MRVDAGIRGHLADVDAGRIQCVEDGESASEGAERDRLRRWRSRNAPLASRGIGLSGSRRWHRLTNRCCEDQKQHNKTSAHRLHDHPPSAGAPDVGIRGQRVARLICFTSDKNLLGFCSMQSQVWVIRDRAAFGMSPVLVRKRPTSQRREGPFADSCSAAYSLLRASPRHI